MKPPISVISEVQQSWKDSPERRADTWPQGDHITWMFPGNEKTDQNPCRLNGFDGEFYPPQEIRDLFKGKEYPAESAMLIGTDGAMLIPHQELPILLPEEKFVNYKRPEFEAGNHSTTAFVVASRLGGPKQNPHFAQTGPMTEAILLGTVANRVPDQLLEWDSVNLKFTNSPRC